MEHIDLNEDNYDYEKILELFSLPHDFDREQLKNAKLKLLKLHPDKSGLDVKYFLFFKKMYLKLEEIYGYINPETDSENLKKKIDIDTQFKNYLEEENMNPEQNNEEYLKVFNEMFEHVYVPSKTEKEGYAEWLKSNENMYNKNDLEESRNMAMNQIVKKNDEIEEYGYFKKKAIHLYDIKESYTNTIVAMDIEQVYKDKPKFASVDEYKKHLLVEEKKNVPLGIMQSKDYLKQKEDLLKNQAKQIAYEELKRKEKIEQKYYDYGRKFLKLTD
jgi:hypothetical protein